MKKMRNSKRGFTLTEIIVVIAIIVIVASAAFVGIAVVIDNAKDTEKKSWRDENSRELFEVEAWDEVDDWTYNVARFFDASTYTPVHTSTPTPTPTTAPTATPTTVPQNGSSSSSSSTNTPTPSPTATNTPTATPTPTTASTGGTGGSVNLSGQRSNAYTNGSTGYYQQYVTFSSNNFAGKKKLVMTYTYTGGSVSNVGGNWNGNDNYTVNGNTITVKLDMNSDTWRFSNGKEIYIQLEGTNLSGVTLASVDAE